MLICIRIGSCKQPTPGGPIPHNLAQTFDGPPTLERSGPEHRVGRLHPRFLRFLSPRRGIEGVVKTIEEGLGEKVELSLQERRRGRKMPFLMLKKVSVPCKGNRKGRKDY